LHYKLLILAATTAWGASVSAQAAPAGITYDCDTAADHYSELVLPAPAGQFVVKGKVKILTTEKNTTFVPQTRLVIGNPPANPGAASTTSAGFSLTALPAKAVGIKAATKDAIVQFTQLENTRDGKRTEAEPTGIGAPAEIPFAVTYDGTAVTTKASENSGATPLQLGSAVVRITCSTGEFLYTDLVIEALPAKAD
jgi:hypothetical protein